MSTEVALSGEANFIGIDLAWSAHNPTGIAALRWQDGAATLVTPLPPQPLRTDDEIIDYVRASAGQGSVFIAVDAPLIVPNETGRRPAETAISRSFGKFHAS